MFWACLSAPSVPAISFSPPATTNVIFRDIGINNPSAPHKVNECMLPLFHSELAQWQASSLEQGTTDIAIIFMIKVIISSCHGRGEIREWKGLASTDAVRSHSSYIGFFYKTSIPLTPLLSLWKPFLRILFQNSSIFTFSPLSQL